MLLFQQAVRVDATRSFGFLSKPRTLAQQVQFFANILLSFVCGDRFDSSYAGCYGAFGYYLEQTDLAGSRYVRSTTKLDGDISGRR